MGKQTFLIGCFCVGISCIGYSMYRLYRNWQLLDSSKSATATVTHLETKLESPEQEITRWDKADSFSQACYETFIFYTEAGEKIVWQFPISIASSIGETNMNGIYVPPDREAEIVYNPADPYHFEYASFSALWVQWFLVLILGSALLSLPLGVFDAVVYRLTAADRRSTEVEKISPLTKSSSGFESF